jgi:hypothetical protein
MIPLLQEAQPLHDIAEDSCRPVAQAGRLILDQNGNRVSRMIFRGPVTDEPMVVAGLLFARKFRCSGLTG